MRATPVFVVWVVFSGLALGVQVRKHFLVDVQMTWEEARSYCRQNYSDLTTIITKLENYNLRDALQQSSALSAWIGLHRCHPVFVVWVVFSGLALGVRVREHFLVDVEMTWEEAQSYCRQNNSDLSTIITDAENLFLEEALTTHPTAIDAWIGLHRCHPQSAETCTASPWEWSDGDVSTNHGWALGQPDTEANSESCVEMWYLTGLWYDGDCHSKRASFCFKWSPDIILVTERMSWEEALLYCRERYTDLASLLIDAEMALADKKVSDAHITQVWTSLRFLAGEWLWVSETQEADQKFTQGNLPSCPAHPYSCGARSPDGDRWRNLNCQEKLNFLCYRA